MKYFFLFCGLILVICECKKHHKHKTTAAPPWIPPIKPPLQDNFCQDFVDENTCEWKGGKSHLIINSTRPCLFNCVYNPKVSILYKFP